MVRALRALFCVLIAVSTISAQTADTTIASRNAKFGGLEQVSKRERFATGFSI